MSIKIVTATINDVAILAEISKQTFYDSFAANNSEEDMRKHLEEYYAVPVLETELKHLLNRFLFAYENDTLLGYAKITTVDKPEAAALPNPIELERIYAVKAAIGKGVGKALMQAYIDTANQQKRTTLWLGVWEHNPRAIAFYKQWGFEKFGEHVFVVGNDPQTDWLMKRTLTKNE